MFAEARDVENGATLRTDVCIIGGGAAGIALARELFGSPFDVTVLESGGFDYEIDTQALYDGRSIGQPYSPLNGPRLRYFGGTTGHWGGYCRPFDEADFEVRDGIPHTGWPIKKAEVDPYYPLAARVCGLPAQAWNPEDWVGRTGLPTLRLKGDRIVSRVVQVVPTATRHFGARYRSEFRRVRNATVYLHANVTGIETDDSGRTATSVRVETLTGNRFSVRAKAFVLATGAIENPRLLLVSDDRWPDGLGNRHGLVGRFFMEHARYLAGFLAASNPQPSLSFYERRRAGGASFLGYLASSKELQLAESLLDVQIRLEPGYGETANDAGDLARHVMNLVTDLESWQRITVPGSPLPIPFPEVLREAVRSPRDTYIALRGASGKIGLTTRFEQAPNPDSRVLLVRERDELGMRRVALDWRLSDIDKRNVRRTLEVLGAEVGRAGLGRLKILHDEAETGWPADLGGGQHLMGTTRMSDDPRRGVVDRNCRVHGMANLFIAGSSVFPTAGGATPTLTLVALSLRLADHLKSKVLR